MASLVEALAAPPSTVDDYAELLELADKVAPARLAAMTKQLLTMRGLVATLEELRFEDYAKGNKGTAGATPAALCRLALQPIAFQAVRLIFLLQPIAQRLLRQLPRHWHYTSFRSHVDILLGFSGEAWAPLTS